MKKNKVSSVIYILVMIFIVYILFGIYKTHYFNGFIKAEANIGKSEFRRDKNVKYSDEWSYQITSSTQNDAAFYKEIEVEPNTPYRLTCMVKTQDVIPSEINTDGGASISIIEASEISKSITGTNDWQELELLFNSNSRTTIKLGCRLGGNSGTAQGTAWFSDFKLEKGLNSSDTTWNVACFVFKNTDVEVNGERMTFTVSSSEISAIKSDMKNFQNSCKRMTKNKLSINYEIYYIEDPLTTISYSEEHGYYFAPYDVNKMIENTVLTNNYDYIFTVVKMGNNEKEIPVENWVGLRKYGFIWHRFFKHKTF